MTHPAIYPVTDTTRVAPLFRDWEETMIWSCMQGVMGQVYGAGDSRNGSCEDGGDVPTSAMAAVGDFRFLAGVPTPELVRFWPEMGHSGFSILVPRPEDSQQWSMLIEACYQDRARRVTRYATQKQPGCFDTDRLSTLAAIMPPGFRLAPMDETLFLYCKQTDWCRDFVSQYDSFRQYEHHGLGVLALWDGEPVAGASSYTAYEGGIEIEVDTKQPYRRQGLATACSAALILACLRRGWYPSWDAQNPASLSLAEKLGYHFSHAYVAYEVYHNGQNDS